MLPSLRTATTKDAALLARLGAALFEQTFGPDNTEADMRAYLATAFGEAVQGGEIENHDNIVFIAEVEGRAVGYALLRRGTWSDGVVAERPAEIQRIYADREFHGHGLGAQLMAACVEQAQAWEADVLWLAVWQRNPRAIAFYEKQGFRRVGVQTFRLGSDLQHDFVMARFLSSGSEPD